MASLQPYHPFDALREEETVVQGVHGVIRKHLALLLEQKVPSVQAIVSPEDAEAPFLISVNEGPVGQEGDVSLTESVPGDTLAAAPCPLLPPRRG